MARILAKTFLSLSALLAASYSFSLEYHGYFRSGIGMSTKDTDQVCFKGAGTEGYAKLRLGNECDTYLEMQFADEYRSGRSMGDPFFKAYVRLGFKSPGERDWESSELDKAVDETNSDGTLGGNQSDYVFLNQEAAFSLREAYAEGSNLWGPSNTKIWAGKRFYRRRDLYMIDYYLVENSGPGFGVEDVDLGFAKTHFAVMRMVPYSQANPKEQDGAVQTNYDLRLSDIHTPGDGKLETILIVGKASERGSASGEVRWQSLSGWQMGLVHEQEDLFNGKNMLAIQYGKGLFGAKSSTGVVGSTQAFGESLLSQYGGYGTQNIMRGDEESQKNLEKSSTLRVSDELIINPISDLSLGFILMYQALNFGGSQLLFNDGTTQKAPVKNEITTGIRPVYHFSDTLGIALEYGMSKVHNALAHKADNGDWEFVDSRFQKFTIAPQVTASRDFWAYGKPQIRLFYTQATWDDNSKGLVAQNSPYQDKRSGWSTGAQVEMWW